MRKLKLQMQTTIDGYVARPNGELDWMEWNWDDGTKKHVNDLTDAIDCILMGRKMTEGFISYWTKAAENPNDPEFEFAKKMVETPKIVFTKTLDKSPWPNTDLAKGDLVTEINVLKNKNGKDIIVYGGATFVSSLIKAGLIDEYHLFINPAAIGSGMTIFREPESHLKLTLVKSIQFDCGIVALHYEPKRSE